MFNFNEVTETEQIKLPAMLKENVFKNQSFMIDDLAIKEITTLIIGAGSVGSNLAYTMNKFGFSSFIVYDYDIWKPHNSASSIYPFTNTDGNKHKCDKNFEGWTYFPSNYMARNGANMELVRRGALPTYSMFKVDLLEEELLRNDKDLYYEGYRVPFASPMTNCFNKFNQSIVDMNAIRNFRNSGSSIRMSASYIFDWSMKVKPDCMVLTTDSLLSRALSVWFMRELLLNVDEHSIFNHEGVFPVIDTRTLDTTKGEILLFDLLNDQDVLDWFNYSIKVDDRFKSMEELHQFLGEELEEFYENMIQVPFINGTVNLCGNKMSILISNQISVVATNLIVSLFNGKIEWENLPRLYLMNVSSIIPYVSQSPKMINE